MAHCAFGTYTNECDNCPTGSHCEIWNDTPGVCSSDCDTKTPIDCTSGYYSPEGMLANYHTQLGETAIDTTAAATCGDNQFVMYYDDTVNGSDPLYNNSFNGSCFDCQDNYKCSSAGHRTTC
jgi:hypothetical protein